MPTSTYTPLAEITLGSSAASVTFSSISQAYRDLVLVVVATATSSGYDAWLRFNADSSSTYTGVRMIGNGSTASSDTTSGTKIYPNMGGMENTQLMTVNILDYSVTDKHKTALIRDNNPAGFVNAQAARWPSTSAITSVTWTMESGSFAAGSTFALYGIAA